MLSSGIDADSTLDVAGWNRLAEGIRIAERLHRPLAATLVRHADGAPTNRYLVGRAMATAPSVAWTITDSVVANTRDEAVRIRAAYPAVQRVVLVTSRSHTRRACKAFERLGFTVTCRPAGQGYWWHALFAYIYEAAATAKYVARGWI